VLVKGSFFLVSSGKQACPVSCFVLKTLLFWYQNFKSAFGLQNQTRAVFFWA